jgi:hypothetical protein
MFKLSSLARPYNGIKRIGRLSENRREFKRAQFGSTLSRFDLHSKDTRDQGAARIENASIGKLS